MESQKVGAAIRQLRVLRGLTQDEVAERLGVGGTAYSHWETGRTELRMRDYVRLSLALRVPLGTLLLAVGAPLEDKAKPVGEWLDSGAEFIEHEKVRQNRPDGLGEIGSRSRVSAQDRGRPTGGRGNFAARTAVLVG